MKNLKSYRNEIVMNGLLAFAALYGFVVLLAIGKAALIVLFQVEFP